MKKGYIFDLDGTLAKTQKEFHARAEVEVLKRYEIAATTESISDRFAGVHTLEVFKELAPQQDPYDLLNQKWEYMYELAGSQHIHSVDYAIDVVTHFHHKGARMAIASASPLKWIDLCLRQIGIEKYFKVLASADEVKHGKPAPDVFLLAAKRLNVLPVYCTVIDDGRAGAEAGVAAKMKTYWLTESDSSIPSTTKIKTLRELLN